MTSSSWPTAVTTTSPVCARTSPTFCTLGPRLSPAKTQIVHMSDGFDFLGFHIQWRRKRGSNKWYVYTFIAERPIRQLRRRPVPTNRTSQQDPVLC